MSQCLFVFVYVSRCCFHVVGTDQLKSENHWHIISSPTLPPGHILSPYLSSSPNVVVLQHQHQHQTGGVRCFDLSSRFSSPRLTLQTKCIAFRFVVLRRRWYDALDVLFCPIQPLQPHLYLLPVIASHHRCSSSDSLLPTSRHKSRPNVRCCDPTSTNPPPSSFLPQFEVYSPAESPSVILS